MTLGVSQLRLSAAEGDDAATSTAAALGSPIAWPDCAGVFSRLALFDVEDQGRSLTGTATDGAGPHGQRQSLLPSDLRLS